MKPQTANLHQLSPHTQAILGRHGAIILHGAHDLWRLNPRELDKLAAAWDNYRNPTVEED